MAAYDIQKHFKELRVETGRRRGRDPFATGFEDETEEKKNSRRTKAKASPVEASVKSVRSSSSDDDLLDPKAIQPNTDRRLSPAPAQLAASQVSDGAQRSPFDKRSSLGAKAQAGGILAYLDDSDEEGALAPPTSRGNRRPSPAPFSTSDSPQRTRRASSPQAETEISQSRPAIPRHTVASPFAGTKYLQDSDSDSDEETAVTSRHGSTDTTNDPNSDEDDGLGPLYSTNRREQAENKGGKKRKKQNGSGVDWRAFSVSRQEQRSAELEALQANLRRRGKRISFGTHARTDDGEQVPVAASAVQPSGPGNIPRPSRARGRGRSPPRRGEDVEPTADEVEDGEGGVERYDPATHKTNPFTGRLKHWTSNLSEYTSRNFLTHRSQDKPSAEEATVTQSHQQRPSTPRDQAIPTPASLTSALTTSPSDQLSEDTSLSSPALSSSDSNMTTSIDSLNTKFSVSPQTIPESKAVDYSIDSTLQSVTSPICSPTVESPNPLSRDSSVRSSRTTRAARIPGMGSGSRRSSRRGTSQGQTSISPAHAFLSSYNREASTDQPPPDPNPDDEGQSIGLENEYIIGREIARGGFGVVKEVHFMNPRTSANSIRAVKIVHKTIPNHDEDANDKVQQDLEHEVSVWRYLRHRHILKLHAVYETDYATFCVMDLNTGGTLHDLVIARRTAAINSNGTLPKGLDPKLAKRYAYQLARALRYLHEDIRVCHRDVKLENCLLGMSAPDAATEGGVLRLCDFGLADFLNSGSIDDNAASQLDGDMADDRNGIGSGFLGPTSPGRRGHLRNTSSVIGTLEYASPKGLSVHRKLFETAGDVWAFGIIVYALCTGDLPFRHSMPSKTVEMILHSDWDVDALRSAAAEGGEEVIELVKGCLDKDIDMRWRIGDVLRSEWFDGCGGAEEEEREERRGAW